MVTDRKIYMRKALCDTKLLARSIMDSSRNGGLHSQSHKVLQVAWCHKILSPLGLTPRTSWTVIVNSDIC